MPLGSSSAAPVMTPGPMSPVISISVVLTLVRIVGPRRMAVQIEARAEALSCQLAGCVLVESERFRKRTAEQGIAERRQHKRERRLGDLMLLMANAQLRHETADG